MEFERPGGIEIRMEIYDPPLVVYRGKPTQGQRVPEWMEAFGAMIDPRRFESYEAWRAQFGNGEWESSYLSEEIYRDAQSDPLKWASFVAENVSIPWSIRMRKSGVEYVKVPYEFIHERYPNASHRGPSRRSLNLFQYEDGWRVMVNWSSPQTDHWQSARDPYALADRIRSGEYDDWFDFTLHYQSFPEYEPANAGQENYPGENRAAEGRAESAPPSPGASIGDVEPARASDLAPEETNAPAQSSGSWRPWQWALLLLAALGILALVAVRWRRD